MANVTPTCSRFMRRRSKYDLSLPGHTGVGEGNGQGGTE